MNEQVNAVVADVAWLFGVLLHAIIALKAHGCNDE